MKDENSIKWSAWSLIYHRFQEIAISVWLQCSGAPKNNKIINNLHLFKALAENSAYL